MQISPRLSCIIGEKGPGNIIDFVLGSKMFLDRRSSHATYYIETEVLVYSILVQRLYRSP